jgi:cell migration-inducing and hyaluronan-binding protein
MGTSFGNRIAFVIFLTAFQMARSLSASEVDPNGVSSSYAFATDEGVLHLSENVNRKKLSELAIHGQDLLIQSGDEVEIDTSVDVGKMTINGRLICPASGHFIIRTTGVLITGTGSAFICGTTNQRFEGNLQIALQPGLFESIHGGNPSDRNFLVMNGGRLELAGSLKNSRWLRLTRNTSANSREIELEDSVNWSPGDEVVIAPTGYRYDEADLMTVSAVSGNGRVVRFTSGLRFDHWGTLQTFTGSKAWQLDERAEVGNLTRNIRIYADGEESQMDYRGGHVMIMRGASGYVDAVEFFRMGRMGEMARYPFHWHRAGNVQGQFIRNSSIHRSFQRCLTVHGTHNAEVSNNICFDHFGHGFFLEDGDETGNRIRQNLGILSRRPLPGRHLLQSDIDLSNMDRFPGPSTFWISNPKNIITGNVAAGSQGTGIWNSFSSDRYCEAWFCQKPDAKHPANVFPYKEDTLQFSDNIAHSSEVGMTWDGAPDGPLLDNPNNPNDRALTTSHYSPTKTPTFDHLSMFKNRQAAVYFRGNTSYFPNATLADNKVGFFFAYNQVVMNSAVIAKTDNHRDSDYDFNSEFTGIRVYDGPFDLRNLDFINFPASPIVYQGREITPTPILLFGGANRFTNVVQGLRFYPEPFRRVDFSSRFTYPWADWSNSPSLRDLDGSLTGKTNGVLLPDHPFNRDNTCAPFSNTSALLCDQQRGVFIFLSIRDNNPWEHVPFIVKRSDGVWTHPDFEVFKSLPYHLKFGVTLGNRYDYEVNFEPNWVMPGKKSKGAWWPNSFQITFQGESKGQVSPLVAFNGLGQNCRILSSSGNSWQKAKSISDLRRKKANFYFTKGSVLYAKFLAQQAVETALPGSEFAKPKRNKVAMVNCD